MAPKTLGSVKDMKRVAYLLELHDKSGETMSARNAGDFRARRISVWVK